MFCCWLFFPGATYRKQLFWAALTGDLDRIKNINETTLTVKQHDSIHDCRGYTALHYACEEGHLRIVNYLIEHGASINIRDRDGLTPLHVVLLCKEQNLRFEIVKYLVQEAGANVNLKDDEGRTPLYLACSTGHFELVKYLIQEANADVNKQDVQGWNALHRASFDGHVNVVKYLVQETNVDVNKRNNDYRTALHLACSRNVDVKIVEILVQAKNVDFRIDCLGSGVVTALHIASQNGNVGFIKAILEAGREKARSIVNATAIFSEYFGGRGETILHFASRNGNVDIVKALLDHGADINLENREYKSALDLAFEKGHNHVVDAIMQHQKKMV